MPHFIEKYFLPKPNPVTHNDVEPAEGDPMKEREVNSVLDELAFVVRRNTSRSIALRERLAQKTIQVITKG